MENGICNPNTAIEFANIVGGQIHELSSTYGHISFVCEAELFSDLVNKFFFLTSTTVALAKLDHSLKHSHSPSCSGL